MARTNSPLLIGARGRIGDLVIKQYSYGTVITAMPNMPKRPKTELQKLKSGWFAEAVEYAKGIVRDRKKKAEYAKKLPKGKQVYHAAISEYMNRKVEEGKPDHLKKKNKK